MIIDFEAWDAECEDYRTARMRNMGFGEMAKAVGLDWDFDFDPDENEFYMLLQDDGLGETHILMAGHKGMVKLWLLRELRRRYSWH